MLTETDPGTFVSELDVVKEQIAYLKVWLGILVVTDISLFGWLISSFDKVQMPLLFAAVIVILVITAGIWMLHRHIEWRIESLRKL